MTASTFFTVMIILAAAHQCSAQDKPVPYQMLGCQMDTSPDGPAMSAFEVTNEQMSQKWCADTCAEKGYEYAGLKDGKSCNCDHDVKGNGPSDNCSETCPDGSECGGKDSLTVLATQYNRVGCFDKPDDGGMIYKTIRTEANLDFYQCVHYCMDEGSKWMGIAGNECYCGHSRPVTSETTGCKPCTSTKMYEECGSGQEVSVYTLRDKLVPYQMLGCRMDTSSNGPAMSGFQFTSEIMSQRLCGDTCAEKGYDYAGLKDGKTCYCDNYIKGNGPSSDCSEKCPDGSECGGKDSLTVLATHYNREGCVQPFDAEVLVGAKTSSEDMDFYKCLDHCFEEGFKMMGVQDQICVCGNTKQMIFPASGCLPCPSAKTYNEECGSDQVTSLYTIRDTNECEVENGGCEGDCTNTPGGFTCSCQEGATLADNGKSCITPSCPQGSIEFENKCYTFVNKKVNYDQASSSCEGMGGALATLDSAINGFISEELKRQKLRGKWWIGLRREAETGWEWADGADTDFRAWRRKFDCAAVEHGKKSLQWRRIRCSSRNKIICVADK